MHPEESSEYSFPWRAVLLAMGASGYLVFTILAAVGDGRVGSELLVGGLCLFAYAVYGLRRAAREEARLWKQRLKREKHLVGEAVRAEMRGEVESSRPAS